MRVTDLEKFSLEHIWRPYQTLVIDREERLAAPPENLDVTADLLKDDNKWSRLVLARIVAIGVTFPPYIKHPLVDVIKRAHKAAILAPSDSGEGK